MPVAERKVVVSLLQTQGLPNHPTMVGSVVGGYFVELLLPPAASQSPQGTYNVSSGVLAPPAHVSPGHGGSL